MTENVKPEPEPKPEEKTEPKPGTAIVAATPAAEKDTLGDVAYTGRPSELVTNRSLFKQMVSVARLMAGASLVPVHLRDKPSDCFLIVSQAVRWGLDPFAVAQCSYVTKGKVGYEGKLIAAIVNTHPKMAGNLRYEFFGGEKGIDTKGVRVYGKLRGEAAERMIEGTYLEWATSGDGTKWPSMPDQMLTYRGARVWARRHLPEAVLGLASIDEIKEQVAAELPAATVVDSLSGAADDAVEDAVIVQGGPVTGAEKPKPEPEKKAKKKGGLAEAAAAIK